MKFGIRKPSLKGRISARTSWKRYLRHSAGFKAPRGAGFVTNPKKALYNKVYNQTSFSLDDPPSGKNKSNFLGLKIVGFLLFLPITLPLGILYLGYKIYKRSRANVVVN